MDQVLDEPIIGREPDKDEKEILDITDYIISYIPPGFRGTLDIEKFIDRTAGTRIRTITQFDKT